MRSSVIMALLVVAANRYDDGDVGFVAFVLGALRHVLHAAVGVMGVDGELLAILP